MQQIDVAVAVIHYEQHYLLGFRHAQQHQGNRYEFVGGKLEADESPRQALIREVQEEIGLDIAKDSLINPLGVLRHEYPEVGDSPSNQDNKQAKLSKKVCLHVFRVQLSKQQYQQQRKHTKGREGQALTWVSLTDLLSNRYRLPEANKSIVAWLQLGDCICITQGLEAFATANQNAQQWLAYYTQHLPVNSWVYLRLKQLDVNQQHHLLSQLVQRRSDLNLIISNTLAVALQDKGQMPKQVKAQHLTQAQLTKAYQKIQNDTQLQTVTEDGSQDISQSSRQDNNQYKVKSDSRSKSLIQLLPQLPITASCHHATSVEQLNSLAQYRLNQQLSVVIGAYISPVKATKTHPDRQALGWQQFAQIAEMAEVPVIALGGMSPMDLDQVRQYQGDKVAGIRQFLV